MMTYPASFPLDQIAIRLAARSGQAWSDLGEYPGYARNRWREQAREQVLRDHPGAIIEALPERWDGREGGYVVWTGAKC